ELASAAERFAGQVVVQLLAQPLSVGPDRRVTGGTETPDGPKELVTLVHRLGGPDTVGPATGATSRSVRTSLGELVGGLVEPHPECSHVRAVRELAGRLPNALLEPANRKRRVRIVHVPGEPPRVQGVVER